MMQAKCLCEWELTRLKKKVPYTLMLICLPMLSIYATGIPGVTLGELLMIGWLGFFCITRNRDRLFKIKLTDPVKAIAPLIITIPLISMIAISLSGTDVSIADIIVRIVRREFYYVFALLLSGSWFDGVKAQKYIQIAGVIGTVYLLVQYLAYYGFGIIVNGFLPFLPVYTESYAVQDYASFYSLIMFRPTSFLLEPAHFSRYMYIPLILSLFDSDNSSKRDVMYAIVFSIAIFMTTSGTGSIITALIWCIWIVRLLKTLIQSGKTGIIQGAVLAAIPIIAIILMNTRAVSEMLSRISTIELGNSLNAFGARFEGYLEYFKLPPLNLLIGKGYGNTPTSLPWFSGLSYILYCTGIVGLIASLIFFYKIIFKTVSYTTRIIGIAFLMMFIMDDGMMDVVSVIYISFMLYYKPNTASKYQGNNGAFR